MAYIGNTVNNQGFTPAIDYFSGNASTVTFTLSRPVASVAQVIVAIDNVIQNSSTAYSVTGNAITFTSAPLSGSNNIWVQYTSPITTYAAISQDPSVIGDITASGGFLSTGDFGNTYTDGTIVDYVTGMARITTGASDGLTIYNGGTASRTPLTTWTAAGNLGVGTTSPTAKLQVNATNGGVAVTSGAGGAAYVYLAGNNSTIGSTSFDLLQGGSSEAYVYNRANNYMVFGVNNTEKFRLNTNGDLVAGNSGTYSASVNSSVMAAGGIANTSNDGFNFVANKASGAAQGAYLVFFWGGGLTGYVNYNGGGVTYNTTSDVRMKDNIVDAPSAIGTLQSLQVRSFDWKESNKHDDFGFVAQELYEVYPDAVTKQKDKEDGSMDMPWGVDYAKLVPVLVKAVQEQQAIIEDLKARIETLEAK